MDDEIRSTSSEDDSPESMSLATYTERAYLTTPCTLLTTARCPILPTAKAGSAPHHLRHERAGSEQSGQVRKSARTVGDVLGKFIPTATAPATKPWC